MTRLFGYAALLAVATMSPLASAKVWLAGVNIAGFDFGSTIWGGYSASGVTPPLPAYGVDGPGQMSHFHSKWGLNVFRLPVMWQYLVNGNLGGPLDSHNFGVYDQLVQACLSTGAYCVIDIHNYGRWNGNVIGQSNGAVTNAHFTSLWSQLASHYANTANVVFGIMNEPHDLNIDIWGPTVQAVVTAIRNVSPTWHMIFLPGIDYSAVGAFINDGSAGKLSIVKNPDGSTTNLIFDVHQYLDSPPQGTQKECATNGVPALTTLGNWLSANGRQAILTETGGGSVQSCYSDLCSELSWMNYHADVYLGWIGWSAGSFSTSYNLSLTPTYSNGVWTDTGILSSCVAGKFQ